MHVKIDAGTDVAMIGAWDRAAREEPVKGPVSLKRLEQEAAEGKIFYVRTGADGGGPVHVYVEEEMPPPFVAAAREFLLKLPTGKMVVGGVEDYRAEKPAITGDKDVVEVPPGDYALGCAFLPDPEEDFTAEEYRAAGVSDADAAYCRAKDKGSWAIKVGCLVVVLLPIVLLPLGWKRDLGVTAVALLLWIGFTWLWQRRWRRDPRMREIRERMQSIRRWEESALSFRLRRVESSAGLGGGSVHVDELPAPSPQLTREVPA